MYNSVLVFIFIENNQIYMYFPKFNKYSLFSILDQINPGTNHLIDSLIFSVSIHVLSENGGGVFYKMDRVSEKSS